MNSLRLLCVFALILGTAISLQNEYEDLLIMLDTLSEDYDFFNATKNCTKTGYICEDCNTQAFCFQLPNGDFIKELQQCSFNETCLEKDEVGACTTEPNIPCQTSEYSFICYQEGYFPDAFNCNRYHLCTSGSNGVVKPIPTDFECPKNYSYDPLTTRCSIKTNKCEDLVKTCSVIGQSGTIARNPALYYVCLPVETGGHKVLFPQIFYCENDFFFDGTKCIDPSIDAGLQGGNCTGTGNFYTPNCTKYNRCTAGEKPVTTDCTVGQKYDPQQKICVPFQCK